MKCQWLAATAMWLALSAACMAQTPAETGASPTTRNGREIYEEFRSGLADPECEPGATSPRWRQHFASAPKRMAADNDDLLPLFGYVVSALREASLPTEYALIPFVESGYRPGARSPSGPAGLWQMIAVTARDHAVPIRNGYDGRLSPIDSTRAAVRYLKTLHGMFAGDWRLAVMAYNAGEYRVLGSLKRSGQKARSATPEQLVGLSDITQAYVRKLHALSCLLEQADDREDWLQALDRPVPRLEALPVPDGIDSIGEWASRTGQDAAQLQRFNPVFTDGRIRRASGQPPRLLAVRADIAVERQTDAASAIQADAAAISTAVPTSARRHTVARGESVSTIARRYGIRVADLLQRNGLRPGSVLRPGQALLIDPLEILADGIPAKTGTP
ncbi:lytic transglycosylase domain-containing protein [Lysobacter niastensis]|nr:lytic transglycosylase domain-containing protein [Lysobacter niastensis]